MLTENLATLALPNFWNLARESLLPLKPVKPCCGNLSNLAFGKRLNFASENLGTLASTILEPGYWEPVEPCSFAASWNLWKPIVGNLCSLAIGNLLNRYWEPVELCFWEPLEPCYREPLQLCCRELLKPCVVPARTWEPGNLGGTRFSPSPICSETCTMAEDPEAGTAVGEQCLQDLYIGPLAGPSGRKARYLPVGTCVKWAMNM